MSELGNVIRIDPTGRNNKNEVLVSRGHKCPACEGKGYRDGIAGSDRERIECVSCGGVGRLRASILIGWGPDV